MREDRLAGLETPGGIRGGPAAVDAEDAPNGDSAQEAGLPETQEEAYARVRASPSSSEGFAFLGTDTL